MDPTIEINGTPDDSMDTTIFTERESEVRSYSRNWPVVFDTAKGATLKTVDGEEYLDFFGGAGALNYGHNDEGMKTALLDYIARDGISHSLDKFTVAKRRFLETFTSTILEPRGLDYKVMFPGPTGTNAVESALKLARKVTGREAVLNFTNSFHGMTLGSLSVTGNSMKRAGAGVPLVHATPMPYDNYFGGVTEDFQWMDRVLEDSGSGMNRPAAVIVECVQGEGGINAARAEWLQALRELCDRHDILLIVDDVQMGCGRTGEFFSFEFAGIKPDIVTLSKSIGGYGLPLALTLFRSDLDEWTPGEHNGTFRGNNLAFVTAEVALRTFWKDDALQLRTLENGRVLREKFAPLVYKYPDQLELRGRGMAFGIAFLQNPEFAEKVMQRCFDNKLLVETAGPSDEVVKFLAPLTLSDAERDRGIEICYEAVDHVLSSQYES
ncbi:diaminobutyrate--2-oxoglutarate transaminase [Dietzia sp. 179-F 9C3 NHS]|uniref:diaminobutyrate--2-oxoglutarate transaminase n=1 Tax=Dietzia sp. 179-F 9C3 NHS TaxID=3374295 RepID=UPI00387A52D7